MRVRTRVRVSESASESESESKSDDAVVAVGFEHDVDMFSRSFPSLGVSLVDKHLNDECVTKD